MAKGDYLGEFEQLILLALMQLDNESYGMPVRQEIETRTGRSTSIGAVYATLERLLEKGYVSSRVGEPSEERGGRAKRFYRIEQAGLRALRESQETVRKMTAGLKPKWSRA